MPAIVFTVRVLLTIEFGGIPCMQSRDVFICGKIDFSPNIDEVAVTSFKTSQPFAETPIKSSLGNSNVHRRRNLDTEPSASKILRDRDSAYCFI